jgi:general secretion pathway protein N
MRWPLLLLAVLALMALAIAFLPMRAVTAVVPGLEAERASGTVWNGRMDAARYKGLPLGDVEHVLAFWPLLGGTADVRFVRLGPELSGRALVRPDSILLEDVEGAVEVPLLAARLPSAPPVTLSVDGARLLVGTVDGCRSAEGEVAAEVRGLPLVGDLALTSGTLACDGDAVLARLSTPRRDAFFEVRGWPDGRWSASLLLEVQDPARRAALAIAGFRPAPGGMTYRVEGGGAES